MSPWKRCCTPLPPSEDCCGYCEDKEAAGDTTYRGRGEEHGYSGEVPKGLYVLRQSQINEQYFLLQEEDQDLANYEKERQQLIYPL